MLRLVARCTEILTIGEALQLVNDLLLPRCQAQASRQDETDQDQMVASQAPIG